MYKEETYRVSRRQCGVVMNKLVLLCFEDEGRRDEG
jgi:hypothetical protein